MWGIRVKVKSSNDPPLGKVLIFSLNSAGKWTMDLLHCDNAVDVLTNMIIVGYAVAALTITINLSARSCLKFHQGPIHSFQG